MTTPLWGRLALACVTAGALAVTATPALATPSAPPGDGPTVSGPIPGAVPGDRLSPVLEETYPFFSTPFDLASKGYVEQEFYLSGVADGYDAQGVQVATDVPYKTRIVVRRPSNPHRFNGVSLVEWQNVTAGYDLDALWNAEATTRDGYAWIGVSAQRVGVDQLKGWSPTRYGSLDVTGGGQFTTDQLSYDIFAQAGQAVARHGHGAVMGGLRTQTLIAVGASQSAARMTIYYDKVLPQREPVFEGYGFIVGNAPTRVGTEKIFHVLSETDVRVPARRADSDVYRRWDVAGGAHSGYEGQVYRAPISERDLPTGAPVYNCAQPPFSRVPVHHVTAAAYQHLAKWVEKGTAPPTAEGFQFNADGTKVRNALGLAQGGIQLSQVSVPRAVNTGDNAGETFCRLFGSHVPLTQEQLDALYPYKLKYVTGVAFADLRNLKAGYLLPEDAVANVREALKV